MEGDTRRQGASRARTQISWPGRPRAGKEGAVALCKHGSVKQLCAVPYSGEANGCSWPIGSVQGRALLSGLQGVEQGQPPLVILYLQHFTLNRTHKWSYTHTRSYTLTWSYTHILHYHLHAH